MNYIAVLSQGDRIYYGYIPENGKITIGSGEKDTVRVSGYAKEEIRIHIKGSTAEVTGKSFSYPETRYYPVGVPMGLPMGGSPVFGIFPETGRAPEVLTLPYSGTVRIGRDEKQNDVVIRSKMMSRAPYIRISAEGGIVRAEDRLIDGKRSSNGLYHNGKRITSAVLKSGDVLSVLQIKMVYKGGSIYFENVPEGVLIKKESEAPKQSFEPKPTDFHTPQPKPQGETYLPPAEEEETFRIATRLREKLPDRKIVLAVPPAQPSAPQKVGVLGKVLGPMGMILSTAVTGIASPALLAARAASLISPVASSISGIKLGKKNSAAAKAYLEELYSKYSDYMEQQTQRIKAAADDQRRIITQENPTPQESIRIAKNREKQLWWRRVKDNDFMSVRIGNGYERLCVPVITNAKENGFEMEYNELRDMLDYVIEGTRMVDNVPARLKLQEHSLIGVQGTRAQRVQFMRNFLVSLTAAHNYEDVRIVGFFDEEDEEDWAEMRWLPHVWDENNQMRYLAFNQEQRNRLAELFEEVLKDRKEKAENEEFRGMVRQTPFYLFLVGSRKCLEHLKSRANLDLKFKEALLHSTPQMCVSTLLLYDDTGNECEYFVDLNEQKDSASAYDANAINRKYCFTQDLAVDQATFSEYARDLATIKLEKSSGKKSLPDGITFLQGYNVKKVEELNVRQHWQKRAESCAFEAPIGVLETGQPFRLNLNDHGPHGLVAGGTGSGKSEMLKAWILSVCINYHPHDVNFIIIDYKGGGLASNLEKLPHVVGSITNIGSGIYRSMSSLTREAKRRQELFAKVGAENYEDYKKAYHKGLTTEWLPMLLLVSDEFRQLKEQEPEFIKSLVEVAVIGRSLGIRMVLSTQSPAGVVDEQIDANVSFRICLKTNTAADSSNMLKTPDAFKITRPGRCYVKVGGGEVYEQVQTFWSGAAYAGEDGDVEAAVNKVKRVEITGERVERLADKGKTSDITEQIAMIQHMQQVAEEMGIEKLPAPWKADLPETLFPEDLPVAGGFDGRQWQPTELKWLQIPVGLYDLPEMQEQGLQMLDLFAMGHYGIYGTGGTGKTTLLKTIIAQACRYYTPNDVVFYGVDCGAWSLYEMRYFPHVGDIVLSSEEEKFRKLMLLLSGEMDRRKKLFYKHKVTSLTTYRKTIGNDLPAMVVVIDNLTSLFEYFPSPDVETQILQLVANGSTYGMHLVYTANGSNGVKFKILNSVNGGIAYTLTDKSDYSLLVGKSETPLPKNIVGRAYCKGKPPVQFQTALWENHGAEEERNRRTEALAKAMDRAWKGNRPVNIPIMPEIVTAEDLLPAFNSKQSLILGMEYDTVAPAVLDLSEKYCALLVGGFKTGKSALLTREVQLYLKRFPDTWLYVIDSAQGAQVGLRTVCREYATNSNATSLSTLVRELGKELNRRQILVQQGADIQNLPALLLCMDDEPETFKAMLEEDVKPMTTIMRNAKGLGLVVLAAGKMGDVSAKYNMEPVLRAIWQHQKGIAISDRPSTHATYFGYGCGSLSYEGKETALGKGNGMYFEEGACRRIKLLGEE